MTENTELNSDIDESLGFAELHQKIAKLQADLAAAQDKAQENWDLALRTKADEENARKRSRMDVENAHKYGTERFARAILNIVDSLERGIESADQVNAENNDNLVKTLKEGMELTLKLLLDTLDQFGIKMLNPIGEMFNPLQHEALTMQESQETPNTVLVVAQKGFTLHDRILRPARVVGAKKSKGE